MRLEFHTTVQPRGPAAAIVLTDEQVRVLAEVKNPPVTVTIDGVTVRVRVARMGEENLVGLSKSNRHALGVEAGDQVDVVVALDSGERTVEVPPELAAALAADPAARTRFDALSYTRRREYAESIAGAKQLATKQRRVDNAMDALRAGPGG